MKVTVKQLIRDDSFQAERLLIDGKEVEIAPDDWIMAVDADNTDLFLLSCDYNIVWKQCPCLEGVRLEDVTPELSDLAYNEVKNS
jgi:hypothetical protein